MTTTIALLLQMAAALLMGAQNNSQMSLAAKQQVVASAAQTIQLSTQALAKINFAVPQNTSMWPNSSELAVAPYLDASGNYVQLGNGVQLVEPTISFGDINGDGVDDAMAVVLKNPPASAPVGTQAQYFLAAILNQGGIMFNIADMPLGTNVQVSSHQIQNGVLMMSAAINNQPSSTVTYMLLGNQLLKVQ